MHSTDSLPASARADHWNSVIAKAYFPLDLTFRDAASFQGQLDIGTVGDLSLVAAGELSAGTLAKVEADLLPRIADAEANGLTITHVLETHFHADFLSGHLELAEATGAKIVYSSVAKPEFDYMPVADGERYSLGEVQLEFLHTPGHTPACVTYLIGDAAFVGDTLFMPDYGTARSDFPGGSAEALYASIRKILSLPDATRMFVGHDYLPEGRTSYAFETTVAEQKAKNIHVHDGVDEAAFVQMRTTRDAGLGMPTLLLPAGLRRQLLGVGQANFQQRQQNFTLLRFSGAQLSTLTLSHTCAEV